MELHDIGIIIGEVSTTAAVFIWESRRPSPVTVSYNFTAVSIDEDVGINRFVCSDLTPNQLYIVRVTYPCGRVISGSFKTLPIKKDLTYNIIACNFPEMVAGTSPWTKVPDAHLTFHIGDQIYMDQVFNKWEFLLSNMPTAVWDTWKDRIVEDMKDRYRQAWTEPNQAFYLAHHANIMIPDDHEVTDGFNGNPWLRSIAIDVFKELQLSLRLNDAIEGTFSYINVIETETERVGIVAIEHLSSFPEMIAPAVWSAIDGLVVDRILLILGRPPLPCSRSVWSQMFDNGTWNETNLTIFWGKIFALPYPVHIVGGDVHLGLRGTITNEEKSIGFMAVGPITNMPDPVWSISDYENGALNPYSVKYNETIVVRNVGRLDTSGNADLYALESFPLLNLSVLYQVVKLALNHYIPFSTIFI